MVQTYNGDTIKMFYLEFREIIARTFTAGIINKNTYEFLNVQYPIIYQSFIPYQRYIEIGRLRRSANSVK